MWFVLSLYRSIELICCVTFCVGLAVFTTVALYLYQMELNDLLIWVWRYGARRFFILRFQWVKFRRETKKLWLQFWYILFCCWICGATKSHTMSIAWATAADCVASYHPRFISPKFHTQMHSESMIFGNETVKKMANNWLTITINRKAMTKYKTKKIHYFILQKKKRRKKNELKRISRFLKTIDFSKVQIYIIKRDNDDDLISVLYIFRCWLRSVNIEHSEIDMLRLAIAHFTEHLNVVRATFLLNCSICPLN